VKNNEKFFNGVEKAINSMKKKIISSWANRSICIRIA